MRYLYDKCSWRSSLLQQTLWGLARKSQPLAKHALPKYCSCHGMEFGDTINVILENNGVYGLWARQHRIINTVSQQTVEPNI